MEEQEIELLKKKIRINRMKLVSDMILIFIFVLIGLYIYFEIENFKALGGDVCRMCEEKTGGVCVSSLTGFVDDKTINHPKINASKLIPDG